MTRLFTHCPFGTPGPPGVGSGCGHLEWLDLADSRPAYEGMRTHLSGLHGGVRHTPEGVESMLSGLKVYELLKMGPLEHTCGDLYDHSPHNVGSGRCYGSGPFRRTPKRETWPPTNEEAR